MTEEREPQERNRFEQDHGGEGGRGCRWMGLEGLGDNSPVTSISVEGCGDHRPCPDRPPGRAPLRVAVPTPTLTPQRSGFLRLKPSLSTSGPPNETAKITLPSPLRHGFCCHCRHHPLLPLPPSPLPCPHPGRLGAGTSPESSKKKKKKKPRFLFEGLRSFEELDADILGSELVVCVKGQRSVTGKFPWEARMVIRTDISNQDILKQTFHLGEKQLFWRLEASEMVPGKSPFSLSAAED
ncbi:hypothetical protein Celaphus_00009864 [Cervus elaphus hippelaphus]|uniref:Uncharacterized protein n=1 Tax=Cervus elaphus hippelaphus TaxID=46360 RepID=A0A212C0H5_CEREH|nr:hypothetical protein Celaphus_00009864 [Cervus elaphus hippelaphus]